MKASSSVKESYPDLNIAKYPELYYYLQKYTKSKESLSMKTIHRIFDPIFGISSE